MHRVVLNGEQVVLFRIRHVSTLAIQHGKRSVGYRQSRRFLSYGLELGTRPGEHRVGIYNFHAALTDGVAVGR